MADMTKVFSETELSMWEAYNEDTPGHRCQAEARTRREAIAWFRDNWEPSATISVYRVYPEETDWY